VDLLSSSSKFIEFISEVYSRLNYTCYSLLLRYQTKQVDTKTSLKPKNLKK
jgi:hypothetical protein